MTRNFRWIEPQKLKSGDRVGVVAPAGPLEPGTLDKGLAVLRQMGFDPVEGRHVRKRAGFLAGGDAERADDLMTLFRDPDVRAIVCARGGYGVNRILPLLKAETIRNNPKWLVGSSDITLLLVYLNQRCRMVAGHGPMAAASFGCRPMRFSRGQLKCFLTQDSPISLHDKKSRTLNGGTAEGRLTGGNLTLLCRSLGTPYEVETRNSILLIEDVNEPAYRIDGMLWQLKQAGKFKGINGVILGEMVGCRFNKGQKGRLDDVFLDHLGPANIPVLANCPVGHGNEIWTVPMGRKVLLNAGRRVLTF